MSSDPDELSQSFRNRLTGDVVSIPAATDPKTGKHIILWRDIQAVFRNAESVRNGKSFVPFMMDENLEQ